MESPEVVAAAAAAILPTSDLEDVENSPYAEQKFYVHPHVSSVDALDAALGVYIDGIYDRRTKIPDEIPLPKNTSFSLLKTPATVVDGTRGVATALQECMEGTNASPGIVFGFSLKLDARGSAWGIVKADLDDAERFFMRVQESDGSWTLDSVRDVLPPPKTQWAKFAIAPRPKAPGGAGVRDLQSSGDMAAGYFLSSLGVVVERNEGAKAALATAARSSGYSEQEIQTELSAITQDTALEDVINSSFPDITEKRRKTLAGTQMRPRTTILGEERLVTRWTTKAPRFELVTDDSVDVKIEGSTITVTLPDDHGPIARSYGG